jgi:lactose/L-arabinose transport system substrate-binding protein
MSILPDKKVAPSKEESLEGLDRSKTVVVWSWNTAAKALKELIPEFNKQYPDIKVVVQEYTHDEAQAKFKQATSQGGDVPDVWDAEGQVTAFYASRGNLQDITSKASKYMSGFTGYKAGEVTLNGRIYAVPWDSAPVAVFYRRDLFEKAGVNPDSIKTWDDYIEAGKKLTVDLTGDGKPDQYMGFLSARADVSDTFEILLQQGGGSLYSKNGDVTFNDAKGVQAVNVMKKLLASGIMADIGWWSPQFYDSFKTGRVATYTQGVWLGGQIKDLAPDTSGKWGVMPMPAITSGGIRSAIKGGSNLAVSTGAKNPDGAWKFIEFALTRKASQLKMYESYNIFPALKSTYTDPSFLAPNPFFGNQKTSEIFIRTQAQLLPNWFYGPYYAETTNMISGEVVNALNDRKSPQQALNDAAAKAKDLITGKAGK